MLGSRSIEAARAFSALAGALAVPAVWLAARAGGVSRRAGWIACVLVAVSPSLVYLGQEARTFALFGTVATLALASVFWIEKTDRWAAWLSFAACGAVLVHLHYYAFFVLFVFGLELLWWAWRRGWPAVLRLGAASGLIVLAFLPYLGVLIWQLKLGASRSKETWWQHLALLPSYTLVGRTLVWKDDGLLPVVIIAGVIVVTVVLPVAWFLLKSRAAPRPLVTFALGVPAVVGLLAVAGVPMIHSHYLSVLFPALLLLLAVGLDAGWVPRWRFGFVWVPMIALLLLMPPALARVWLVQHKTDWKTVAEFVGQPNDPAPVYFYEDLGAEPFAYYRPDQERRLLHPPFGKDGETWKQRGSWRRCAAVPMGSGSCITLRTPRRGRRRRR